jgi:uncharacterized protein YijF (DUF1287 family)
MQIMKRIFVVIIVLLIFVPDCQADTVKKIVAGAYDEIHNETKYNTDMLKNYYPPTFVDGNDTGKAVYPNGDVNPKEGICADLVVRALRNADIDLQKLVHRDILSDKDAYGIKVPDKYIDQRRVWVLKTYFRRNWKSVSLQLDKPKSWQPGDIVIWNTGSTKHLHIGIIGKKRRSDGLPYVIHNMRYVPFVFSGKTVEQDILEGPEILWINVKKWEVIGHYRAT